MKNLIINSIRGLKQNLNYYTNNNTNESSNKNDLISWTLDSGASYHMTHNLGCLHNIHKHQEIISFADGGTVKSKYIGTFTGYINENKITLKNVLYIPSFKRSLMSIYQLCNQYFKILFYNYNNKNKVSIFDKNGNKICSANSTNYNI